VVDDETEAVTEPTGERDLAVVDRESTRHRRHEMRRRAVVRVSAHRDRRKRLMAITENGRWRSPKTGMAIAENGHPDHRKR
jgi:hypothetical protein